MSKKRLLLLVKILLALSKSEIQVLINYLKSFHTKYGDYEPKTIRIVQAIRENPDISYDELFNQLSDGVSANSFDRMLLRLYDKVTESLTHQFNISNDKLYSESYQKKFELRQKLSVAEIIHGRGLFSQAYTLYEVILEQSEEAELFDLYIETAHIFMNLLSVKGNTESLLLLTHKVEYIDQQRTWVNKCKLFRNTIVAKEAWKQDALLCDEVGQKIKLFQEQYDQFPSLTLYYWLTTTELNYLEYLHKYEKGEQLAEDLLKKLQENPVIYTGRRKGVALFHLAENQIMQLKLKAAITNLELASDLFGAKSPTAQLIADYKFKAYYYEKNYGKAYGLIKSQIEQGNKHAMPYIPSKRYYFRACINFLRKKYKLALSDLQKTTELDQDREGWNLNIRLLTIMNLVELKKYDEADREISNLYKLINALRKKETIGEEYIQAFRLLNTLKKTGFHFSEVLVQAMPIELSATPHKRFLSPMLISFPEWYQAKCRGIESERLALQLQ